jgi:hypothetical protein
MPKAAGILNIISGALFLLGNITILGLLGRPTMTIPWANYAMYSMGLGVHRACHLLLRLS